MKNKLLSKKIRTRLRWFGAAAAVLAAVAAVGLAVRARHAPTVAVIPRTCGTWLWEAEHTGVARVASVYGINVYYNAPMREDDVPGQIEVLAQSVHRKMQGAIIAPVEALPLRTPVRQALAAGIPVVVVGTDLGLPPSRNLAYVLNDETCGGKMAALRLGTILNGHGTVAILGISNKLTSTAERARSLETTLAAEFPEIHVVYRSLALPTVSQEQQVAERLLAEAGHVDAIVALSESSTRGAFYALTEFNQTLSTHLIGFDQTILAPVRTGEIDSVIMQNTYRMGRVAMQWMAGRLRGETRQGYLIVPPVLVTRQTIDSATVKETLDLAWYQP